MAETSERALTGGSDEIREFKPLFNPLFSALFVPDIFFIGFRGFDI